MQSELLFAKARDEVIEKRLVERQAVFLLVALRQQVMTLLQTYARRILILTDANQAARILREMAVGVLSEIRNLPQKVTHPNRLEELEEKDSGDGAGEGVPRIRSRSPPHLRGLRCRKHTTT
jgi:hypothetical protein